MTETLHADNVVGLGSEGCDPAVICALYESTPKAPDALERTVKVTHTLTNRGLWTIECALGREVRPHVSFFQDALNWKSEILSMASGLSLPAARSSTIEIRQTMRI